jgi:uncharacterized repeat protein (TIGR01451 family)
LSSGNPNLVFDRASGMTDTNGTFTAHVASAVITNGIVNVQAKGTAIGSTIVRFIGGDPAVSVFGLPKILAGQNLVYAVRVSNDGLLPVHNITVRAGLPIGTSTFESERHPADVQLLSQSGNQLTWLVPGLGVGETRLLYVVGRSARNLTLGTRLTFGAQVSASPDASLSNDEALFVTEMGVSQAPTAASQPEKLNVTYSASPATANVGETVTLQVAVTNATSTQTLYNVQAFARWKGLIPDLVLTWPDALHPGRLLPGETATSTFSYTIPPDFPDLTATPEYTWASAVDSDPSDTALVAAQGALSGLTANGPGVTVSIVPDKTTAPVGDVVHFTITVRNDGRRNESATALVVTDGLTGQTHILTPDDPLAPGQSATATFDYTVQAADAPQFTVWTTVTGHGDTYPNVAFSASGRTIVSVGSNTTPGTMNLSIDSSSIPPVLLPGVPINLPLLVAKSGSEAADNVTLRLTLPPGVDLVDLGTSGDSRNYDAATRRVLFTWNSLNAGANVSPIIQTNAPLGSTLDFDVAVSSDTPESTLTDNVVTLALPVVAPVPAKSSLEALDRTFVVADNQDSLTLRLTARNQLGQVMPDVNAFLLADGPGVTLTPQNVTTDENG